MRVWLLGWNPQNYDLGELLRKQKNMENKWIERWTCVSRQPQIGDRVFLVRVGDDYRGLVGAGHVAKESYTELHYDQAKSAQGIEDRYIDVAFDHVQLDTEDTLSVADLLDKFPNQTWTPHQSGIEIKPEDVNITMLEKMWGKKTGSRKNFLNYAKTLVDINPYEHDGSYEFVNKVVELFRDCEEQKKLDRNDLDLLYLSTVHTDRNSIDVKKERIHESNLSQDSKKLLINRLDELWQKAATFGNSQSFGHKVFGMFGTGQQRTKATDESAHAFIELCVNLLPIDDAKIAFTMAEDVLKNKLTGIQAAVASQILHCLKPNIFPIINGGNEGKNDIYQALGISLKTRKQAVNYIYNARLIEKFRNTNFKFKNYRVLDLASAVLNYDYSHNTGVGDWYPSKKLYDTGLTKDDFVRFLNDGILLEKEEKLLLTMMKLGGIAHNKVLVKAGLEDGAHLRATDISQRICKKYNIQELGEENAKYWPVAFLGRKSPTDPNEYYEYKIREEFQEALKEVYTEEVFMKEKKNDVKIEKNVILFGPPGTGKTYNTKNYAVSICDPKGIEEVKSEDYQEVIKRYDEYVKRERIMFTTFHQSYSYEDFIEGIQPVISDDKNITYEKVDGVFKAFCLGPDFDKLWGYFIEDITNKEILWGEVAPSAGEETKKRKIEVNTVNNIKIPYGTDVTLTKENARKLFEGQTIDNTKVQEFSHVINYFQRNYVDVPRVFIIDEINRGNISKIFGELITLIESSKRKGEVEAMEVTLPYSKDVFTVPNNIYIIGTMNTADRSIALMDTALRRRFVFEEVMPKPELLKDKEFEGLNLEKILKTINRRIEVLYDREHMIGHSYFMEDNLNLQKLGLIFKTRIIPLLQEYFYEDYEKIRLVLGDNVKTSEDYVFIKEIANDNSVFKDARDTDSYPEYRYEINEDAFFKIESYQQII